MVESMKIPIEVNVKKYMKCVCVMKAIALNGDDWPSILLILIFLLALSTCVTMVMWLLICKAKRWNKHEVKHYCNGVVFVCLRFFTFAADQTPLKAKIFQQTMEFYATFSFISNENMQWSVYERETIIH